MLRCWALGHRYRYRADGSTMIPECERCQASAGAKPYGSASEAERYARAFDSEDRAELGKRAPLIGLLPLRLWRRRR